MRTEYLAVIREIVSDRTAAGPYETKWSNNKRKKKSSFVVLLRSSQIQTMRTMPNGATLIKKGAAEFHKLLPWCKDHPALVDDAAKADALVLVLSPLELELVEPVVVVPAEVKTLGVLTAVEVMSVDVGVGTVLEFEGDVVGSVAPEMESEDTDAEMGDEIWVMAKMELVSPESPNRQTR